MVRSDVEWQAWGLCYPPLPVLRRAQGAAPGLPNQCWWVLRLETARIPQLCKLKYVIAMWVLGMRVVVWKDAQHLTGLNSRVLGIVPNYRVTSLAPFCFREEWEFAVSQDASLF